MVDKTSQMFVTGPDVIKTVTGEEVSQEELGGATTHMTKSGVAHYVGSDEEDALEYVKELLSYLGVTKQALNTPLRQLIEMHLVESLTAEDDKRKRMLRFTAEGGRDRRGRIVENVDLLRAYRSAGLNRDARRAVLAQVAALPLPNVGVFVQAAAQGRTTAQDVEWFVSTERLCALMNEVAALPETQLNPGVAAREDFARVSYKGGSEPGVMNLTTQVTTKAGQRLCVSATWNDARALDEGTFMGLYGSLLRLLR